MKENFPGVQFHEGYSPFTSVEVVKPGMHISGLVSVSIFIYLLFLAWDHVSYSVVSIQNSMIHFPYFLLAYNFLGGFMLHNLMIVQALV